MMRQYQYDITLYELMINKTAGSLDGTVSFRKWLTDYYTGIANLFGGFDILNFQNRNSFYNYVGNFLHYFIKLRTNETVPVNNGTKWVVDSFSFNHFDH